MSKQRQINLEFILGSPPIRLGRLAKEATRVVGFSLQLVMIPGAFMAMSGCGQKGPLYLPPSAPGQAAPGSKLVYPLSPPVAASAPQLPASASPQP